MHRRTSLAILIVLAVFAFVPAALGQDGQLLTNVENEVSSAARGWETTVMQTSNAR